MRDLKLNDDLAIGLAYPQYMILRKNSWARSWLVSGIEPKLHRTLYDPAPAACASVWIRGVSIILMKYRR
jgi:hypothetical protein